MAKSLPDISERIDLCIELYIMNKQGSWKAEVIINGCCGETRDYTEII
jgi:hypothetical protein